ncbi:hypothetical protein [Enterococcus faecalis]|nr:hypothetical protein [Enterococcus faecalis]
MKWSAVDTLENPFADVVLPELSDEEQESIDAFMKDYYDDGEFYEEI